MSKKLPKATVGKSSSKGGRPPKYSPETLFAKFNEYIIWAKKNPRIICKATSTGIESVPYERPLTLGSFSIYADIIPETFREYEKQTEFSAVCARVRAKIENDQLEGAMVGQFNPTIASRVLKLADAQEHTGKDGKELFPNIQVEIIDRRDNVESTNEDSDE